MDEAALSQLTIPLAVLFSDPGCWIRLTRILCHSDFGTKRRIVGNNENWNCLKRNTDGTGWNKVRPGASGFAKSWSGDWMLFNPRERDTGYMLAAVT